MFTGIVTDIGEVVASEPRAEGLARLKIACRYDPDTIDIGASIACSGVCLTVIGRGRDGNRAWFAVDAAAETLRVTTVGLGNRGRGSILSARSEWATNSAGTSSPAMPTALPR